MPRSRVTVRLPGALAAVVAACILTLPSQAMAQFTTGVAPPEPRTAPTPAEVIASERARGDTVAVRERLDLRAWVDSAALAIERGESPAAPIPTQPGDTLSPVPVERTPATADPAALPARPRPADPLPRATTVFREGAPAPATATPFPLLVIAGAGLMVGGTLLRKRR